MASVSYMVDVIGKLGSAYITVHQDRCVLVRNRNSDCLRCAEVCTSGCISFDGERLSVSPEKCIGCGTCATICPTCALEAHHPNDAQLMQECFEALARTDGLVTIACGEALECAKGICDIDKMVRVECLGRVDETALTELAAQGAREVVLVHGACLECEHETGRRMVEQVLETEQTLLEAWGCTLPISLSDELPSQVRAPNLDCDGTTRQALEQEDSVHGVDCPSADSADGQHRTAAGPVFAKVMEDGTLPHFIPDRRSRLLDALAQIGAAKRVAIETRLWGQVLIDTERCSSCRMCAVFCPTGALRKFDYDDGSFGVEHYAGDCVKCRTCSAICPVEALALSEEVVASEMFEGMTIAYQMKEPLVRKGHPHAILSAYRQLLGTTQVYER